MFKKATKTNLKLRLAISGLSGSGKTYSSLAIATNLGSSIAVIDTEHGSASRYADIFSFDTCELDNFHPAKYIEAINEAQRAGYEVIVIDSLSHAWFAELDMVDKAKNKFTAWAPVRELERKLIDTIIACPSHVIATMRTKTEWDTSSDNGKMKPVKIGTAPVQAAGIEYEFDLFGELNQNHILHITKSRCRELQDKSFLNPGRDLAEELMKWLSLNPWSNWKSEEDAIDWGQQQLPDISREVLEREFADLSSTNGKKAPLWVKRVTELGDF